MSNGLHALYTNVDGVISKLLELRDLLSNADHHVICLTETKLKDQIKNDVLVVLGYNIFRRDRVGKMGGGVMIMARNDLQAKEIMIRDSEVSEIVAVDIKLGKEHLQIINVCMPPLTNAWNQTEYEEKCQATLNSTRKILHNADGKHSRVILTGDFNGRNIYWVELEAGANEQSWSYRLLDLMMDFFMHQHVREPTRVRGQDEPSTLDLIFTRTEDEADTLEYLPPLG